MCRDSANNCFILRCPLTTANGTGPPDPPGQPLSGLHHPASVLTLSPGNIHISHFIMIVFSLQVPADSPLSLPLHPAQTSSGARPTGRPGLVSLEVNNKKGFLSSKALICFRRERNCSPSLMVEIKMRMMQRPLRWRGRDRECHPGCWTASVRRAQ